MSWDETEKFFENLITKKKMNCQNNQNSSQVIFCPN